MKKYINILTILMLIISCQKAIDKNDLRGKWSGFENDSIYVELWFNDSLLLSWNELSWSYEIMPYQINEENSLIKTSIDDFNTYKYLIKIDELNKQKLKLSNETGKWALKKISELNPIIELDIDDIWKEIGKRNRNARR